MKLMIPIILFAALGGSICATEKPDAPNHPAVPAFTVGAATRDITPQPGVSITGTISRGGKARGVNDPLMVRATVIESGGARVAIAIVDACFLGDPVFDKARRLITKRTRIADTHVLIAATHTHAAPRAWHVGRLSELDDAWHEALPGHIADAVAKADKEREPAVLSAGKLELGQLVKSRRYLCEPSSVPVNPFGEKGESVASVQSGPAKRIKPAGPVDPDFAMLYAARADGSPLMLLGNFSIHYCGGYADGKVSADYFGAFCRHLERRLAPQAGRRPFTALHSNGTSGDVGAIETPAELADRKFQPFERCEVVGEWLAATIARQIPKLQPLKGQRLDAKTRFLAFGVRKPSAQRLAWAAGILSGKLASPHKQSKTYADEAQKLAAYPASVELPVQALRIGDLTIAASPCETFAETGLAIKAASRATHTFTIGLANGCGGYLPTALQHRLGGYETWNARSSFLATDSEAKLREAIVGLVE